jgi:lipoyl(octanoyl) transferase
MGCCKAISIGDAFQMNPPDSMPSDACRLYRLGVTEYQKAWNLQNQLAEMIAGGEHPPALLLLEHPHVYTFGRRGNAQNLLWDAAKLKDRLIDVHWADRGGDVTYHGPGQLVGYPLIPLAGKPGPVDDDRGTQMAEMDYTGYLRKLEKVIIKSLADFGIVGGQIVSQTGVWVQPEVLSRCRHCPPELYRAPAKIASIGVKVDARGISRHGFALNVNTDMEYFEGIIACGLENQNQVKLAHLLDSKPDLDIVAESISRNFAAVFGFTLERHDGIVLL